MDIHTTNPVVENALKACNAAFLKGENVKVVKGPYSGKIGVMKRPNYNGVSHIVDIDGKEVSLMPSEIIAAMSNSCVCETVAKNATDWGMELYKLTEYVKKLVAKSEREGATGTGSFNELFKKVISVLRGY